MVERSGAGLGKLRCICGAAAKAVPGGLRGGGSPRAALRLRRRVLGGAGRERGAATRVLRCAGSRPQQTPSSAAKEVRTSSRTLAVELGPTGKHRREVAAERDACRAQLVLAEARYELPAHRVPEGQRCPEMAARLKAAESAQLKVCEGGRAEFELCLRGVFVYWSMLSPRRRPWLHLVCRGRSAAEVSSGGNGGGDAGGRARIRGHARVAAERLNARIDRWRHHPIVS